MAYIMEGECLMSEFQVYKDLAERTGGEFYLGICGPVRTGKSTFIKRFMDLMVLPCMKAIATVIPMTVTMMASPNSVS